LERHAAARVIDKIDALAPHLAKAGDFMDGDKLHEMCDRTEISEVVYRYATGVDTKDWMLFGTCFTDPMEADMTATLLATPAPQQFPLERWRRITERTLSPWNRTQHYMSNLTIKVDGDRAQCVAYLYARHYRPDDPEGKEPYNMGGYYTFKFVRTPQGWKINSYKLNPLWDEGTPPQRRR
jgi:3-phenylpropionate/cinnamic acid dioxygenase small subunit